MSLTPGSPGIPHRKNDDRAMVDPMKWESTEVGGAEGIAFLPTKDVKKSKVSSIRSSLFQKNMNKGNETDQNTQTFLLSLVFQTAVDAEVIRSRFSFEGNPECLEYCEYGKANKKTWPKDVFAFFHNPIRCELLDLATILRTLQSIGMKLTIGDFVNVRMWWLMCSAILLDYLDMEVKYLEPWIAIALAGKDDNSECSKAMKFFKAMPTRQTDLRHLITTAAVSFGEVCNPESAQNSETSTSDAKSTALKSLSEKTRLLMSILDACAVEVCLYMHEQEELFTPVLTEVYKNDKKDRELLMGKGVKHYLKKGRKRDAMLVLLTRWMSDAKMTKNHIKMIEEWHDCNYSTLVTHYDNIHGNFITQLKE